MTRLFLFSLMFQVCVPVYANVAVFTGSGHTVKLSSTADIRMVSEEVSIVLGRGRYLFDGSVPGMDRVECECKFQLKNLSSESVSIQVGFPLNSQFLKPPYKWEESSDKLLSLYKFSARDGEENYRARFVPADQDKNLGNVFLWDMRFKAGETRELRVMYEMAISMTVGSVAKKTGVEYERKWYRGFESALKEHFSYITSTGKSWAGTIGTARFQLQVGGFEKYLKARGFMETSSKQESDKIRKRFPITHPMVHREVTPAGWSERGGVITWEFKNYVPSEPIAVSYLFTQIPTNSEGLQALLNSRFGSKLSPDDLEDLRDILLATFGIPAEKDHIENFVSNQLWYKPKKGLTVEGLDPDQQDMIKRLVPLVRKARPEE